MISPLTTVLRKGFLQQLSRYGFACADISPDKFLFSLRTEILALQGSEQLVPNWSRFVSADTSTALQKTGIFEDNLPLDNPLSAPALEMLWNDRHAITQEMNQINSTNIPSLGAPSIKIQYNAGNGACFPCHFDSDATVDDRCVTLILYLNPEYLTTPKDPQHAQEQGGHFVAYPIPYPPVSFAPAMGRIVAFSSRNMLHRTLPCRSQDPRVCLTLWFPAETETQTQIKSETAEIEIVREDFMPFVKVSDAEIRALELLLEPETRPHFARLMLAGEWIDSLRSSHTNVAPTLDMNTMERVGEMEDGHERGGSVDAYVSTMVKDLSVIENLLIKHVQSKGVPSWNAPQMRALSAKLPLNGERHAQSNLHWWA
jgi:hypothetical protein